MIQSHWQPEYSLYEKIESPYKLNNTAKDIYQRVTTWELIQTSLNSSVYKKKIYKLVQTAVKINIR